MSARKHRIIYTSLLCLSLFAWSCHAGRRASSSDEQKNASSHADKILFLTYHISEEPNQGACSIKLEEQLTAEGTLKEKEPVIKQPSLGDLEYFLIDRNLKILTKGYIKNPLIKTVEYLNEEGRLEKQDVNLASNQFSLHLQLLPEASSVVIERYSGKPGGNTPLITTEIDKK